MPRGIFWIFFVILLTGKVFSADSAAVLPSSSQFENQFVQFRKVAPLYKPVLDLSRYEKSHMAVSQPIFSPDKQTMVFTEVYYMPVTEQTYSQAFTATPLMDEPISQVISPKLYANLKTPPKKMLFLKPKTPTVKLKDLDPYQYWKRFDPNQNNQRKSLFEVGFHEIDAYQFDALEPVDWSADGRKILFRHHLGASDKPLEKTIPVIYEMDTGDVIRLEGLGYTLLQQYLGTATIKANLNWDVTPLGWSSISPSDMIVKLELLNQQESSVVGLWAFNTETSQITSLGKTIPEDWIAQNGWTVDLIDPLAKGGQQTYATGQYPKSLERPPEKSAWRESLSDKWNGNWRKRLLFWKK
jgi:hypothetical protein